MENKLRKLFEYQRFEGSPALADLITETENRYSGELSEDELSLVSAAGTFTPERKADIFGDTDKDKKQQ